MVPHRVEESAGGCVEACEMKGDGFRIDFGRMEIVPSDELHHVGVCSVEDAGEQGVVGLLFCEGFQILGHMAVCAYFGGMLLQCGRARAVGVVEGRTRLQAGRYA